jgi:hypothetical protein
MARRSARAKAAPAAAPDADSPQGEDFLDPGHAPAGGRRPRASAGGRWWIWVGRVLLWTFLLVVIANGIWMPLQYGLGESVGAVVQPEEEAVDEEPDFPEAAAAAFALGFAEVYLDTEDPQAREEALESYVPEGRRHLMDVDGAALGGENPQVVAVEALDDANGIVTLSTTVRGEAMRLDVPVFAGQDGASLAVSGPPALLAAPALAEPALPEDQEHDEEAAQSLRDDLEGFFSAYAENPEHLGGYLAPSGASVTPLPPGVLEFHDIEELTLAPGTAEDLREAQAVVVWALPGGDDGEPTHLTQSYRLTVTNEGGANGWLVNSISGAAYTH